MKSNKCVILIPIYKEKISFDEYRSILNTYNLYNDKYDIFFMCDTDLNTHNYDKLFNIKYKRHNFKNASQYSFLLLNANFYKEYLQYEYMLIIQPDAYIFNGNLLEYYINKGYPYIGAIFKIYGIYWDDDNETLKTITEIIDSLYVNNGSIKDLSNLINNNSIGMNGGLSLRRIDLLYHLLKNKEFALAEDDEICHIMSELHLFDNMLIKDIINFSIELAFHDIYKKYNIIPFGSHGMGHYFIENIMQK